MKKIISILIGFLIGASALTVSAQLRTFVSEQVGSSPTAGDVLQTNGTISTWVATSTLGLSSGGGHTIQEEGSSLTQRTKLNFVGAGVTATDGGAGTDDTIVTIPSFTLPIASTTILGGIKVGTRLSIDINGVLSADVQSGGGDVLGPATNTDNYIPQWDGTNTKTLKDGLAVTNWLQIDQTTPQTVINGEPIFDWGIRTYEVKNQAGQHLTILTEDVATPKDILITAGKSTTIGAGAQVTITGGEGTSSNSGGAVTLRAGGVPVAGTSDGASAFIYGGVGRGNGYRGGNVNFETGNFTDTATQGNFKFRNTGASVVYGILDFGGLTSADRTFTFPDRSVTLDNITTNSTTNGTGFVKGNGSVISFDNSTYLTAETDPLSLHLDQTSPQTIINGFPLIATGWQFTGTTTPATPAANNLKLYNVVNQGHSHLMYLDDDGIEYNLAEDSVIMVRNTSGAPMTKGQVVYQTGSTGNVPNVSLAKANSLTTLPAIGMLNEDLADGAYGHVIVLGIVSMVDTSAFSTGDRVWVSATTAGALTITRPVYPLFAQRIGSVSVDGIGNGSYRIAVAPFLGGEESGTNASIWYGTNIQLSGLTASEILGTDASKNIVSLPVATYPSLTELSYVKGLSSAVQTQIGTKAASATTMTIAGTANQITSSAGAQDLSANRTWTLSLPADVLIPTIITAPNTGLHLLDTNASHDLIIKPGSDLTADKTLTITTGDADVILNLTAVTDEYVLAYDVGTNTWRGVAASGGGASTALDNLASVAINTTLVSDTDNTDALGTTAIAWSDLFLGSGAVITFNSAPSTADVTLTHAANLLTLAGGSLNLDVLTASELVATDASKNLVSLAVATYPSLTELSYVKGVTSAIQTQLGGKLATGLAVLLDQTAGQTVGTTGARLTKLWTTDITTTNPPTISTPGFISGSKTFFGFTVTNPTAAKYFKGLYIPASFTVTNVHINSSGNVVVGQVWEFDDNGLNGSAVDSSDITSIVDDDVADDGTLSNPGIAAGNYLGWHTTSVTGTPTYVYVTVIGYWN